MSRLRETLERIEPVKSEWIERAEKRQLQLTKPAGSLGRLEWIASRLCAIQQTERPKTRGRCIVVFAADHGVAAEGVSAYPPEVTAQMVANFCAGGAAINAMARVAEADLCVVDIGARRGVNAAGPINTENLLDRSDVKFINRRVREGTRNISREAAMTEHEMEAALDVGIEMAERAAHERIALIGLGEMGIGNTTAASAVTAALTGIGPAQATGRGTGITDETFTRKVKAIESALAINNPDGKDALDVLRKVGGLEIAGLCGLCLGAAAHRLTIITDGFIATAGAALAVRLSPAVADYIFAAHLSTEPGHHALIELINQQPLLNLNLRLGEGTGAALAMPIIAAAAATFNEMATFDSAGVTNSGQ